MNDKYHTRLDALLEIRALAGRSGYKQIERIAHEAINTDEDMNETTYDKINRLEKELNEAVNRWTMHELETTAELARLESERDEARREAERLRQAAFEQCEGEYYEKLPWEK